MIASGILGGACRFEPSCSEYAVEAVREHSFPRAQFLIVERLCKCRPLGPSGFDPVPSKEELRK